MQLRQVCGHQDCVTGEMRASGSAHANVFGIGTTLLLRAVHPLPVHRVLSRRPRSVAGIFDFWDA